ncbi:pyrophosphorylase [Catellatospora tritici]|uniref:pyrophosphorylase n=1 Tax=Catellatospora tritici TaxID=2851566 RepID=UPI001C2D0F8C|nr:pyrophosphorylase [Catellatospora tritici]MBV1850734.1 pyrophosphorylase [Catellatospora tritici]MBV1850987.1 pyrophosphorylase [Catellatospora tritici]
MATVKVTDQAHADAQRLLGIINNQMPTLISQLQTTGRALKDPNNWDGPLAVQYRGVWDKAEGDLTKWKEALTELQQSVQKILTNISRAGGA